MSTPLELHAIEYIVDLQPCKNISKNSKIAQKSKNLQNML